MIADLGCFCISMYNFFIFVVKTIPHNIYSRISGVTRPLRKQQMDVRYVIVWQNGMPKCCCFKCNTLGLGYALQGEVNLFFFSCSPAESMLYLYILKQRMLSVER